MAKKEEDEFLPTRASLLSRLRNWDDQQSWKEFFETYWKMLYSVARRAGLSDAEAQDIVQDTIVAVAKSMPNFQYDPAIGSFKTFLTTITRRRITDFFRQAGRRPRYQVVAEQTSSTGLVERLPDPGGDVLGRLCDEEWEKSILAAALARVKEKIGAKHFQIYDCYVLKEWAVDLVAKNLNVSADLIYTTKHRVTALLREEVLRLEREMI
jgi:RNA polymerase sigma-70 factor (ECF subfamily)